MKQGGTAVDKSEDIPSLTDNVILSVKDVFFMRRGAKRKCSGIFYLSAS